MCVKSSRQSRARRCRAIHVGRPVVFEGRHPDRNEVASGRLAEALDHAGLGLAQFGSEPVAATRSWLWRAQPVNPGIALTVDFGGGTLDLSLVHHDAQRFDVLATTGVALGGDRIDRLIFERMLFPQLGQGERWVRPVDGREVDTFFPFGEFANGLLNWPTTFLLNQNYTRAMVVDRLNRGGAGSEKFQRLLDLISYNYSYNCFAAIRQAKAQLSTVEHTRHRHSGTEPAPAVFAAGAGCHSRAGAAPVARFDHHGAGQGKHRGRRRWTW